MLGDCLGCVGCLGLPDRENHLQEGEPEGGVQPAGEWKARPTEILITGWCGQAVPSVQAKLRRAVIRHRLMPLERDASSPEWEASSAA